MASTTKIMTAIIALENSDLDEEVLISQRAANMGGSVMGLKKDTKVKMIDLLHGLLICSGNDAAVAIAEHVGGSVENFCKMMNEKALELGAYSTNFSNPHGLDEENHYTTAYDLAKITRYALRNHIFNDIVKKTEFYFDGRTLKTTNEMLTTYEGADGVKTGYTGLAGRCLVTSATRDGKRFISVVLYCDTKNLRTSSSQKILDYSFQEYEKVFLLEKGRIMGSVSVERSRNLDEVLVAAAEDLKAILKHNEKDKLYTRVSLPEKVMAPVRRGTILGTVSVFKGDEIIAETSLITLDGAQKMRFSDYLVFVLKNWIYISR
ncbi:MAG TPA: D-alanyl-D-alanine carboxypeptidase, partial [Clostridiaceae bacterium]|nr:D-alanyl-D-alanine carboxypeptidase [Clostridiaceae bacterium]